MNSVGEVEVVDQEVDDVDREVLELPVELRLDLLADLLAVRRDLDALELDGLVLEHLEDARRDDLLEELRADLGVELLDRLVADAVVERDDGVDGLRLLADRRTAADRVLDASATERSSIWKRWLSTCVETSSAVCQGAIVWKPSPRWPTISPNWRTTSTWPASTEWNERKAPQPPITTITASSAPPIQIVPSSRLPCRRRPMPFSIATTATSSTIVEMIR